MLVSGIRYDIDDCPETGVIHLVSPVDSPGNSGVFVEFFSKEAGTKTLTFSINNPDPIGNGNHRLFVQNNDNEGENIILTHDAEVGDWVYREYTCTINVKAGKNTLTLYNNNAETRTDCRINIAYIDFSETTLDENES